MESLPLGTSIALVSIGFVVGGIFAGIIAWLGVRHIKATRLAIITQEVEVRQKELEVLLQKKMSVVEWCKPTTQFTVMTWLHAKLTLLSLDQNGTHRSPLNEIFVLPVSLQEYVKGRMQ